MPNIKSAKKRVKVIETKTLRNKSIKSSIKTHLKKVDAAVESKAENTETLVRATIKQVDQAAAKGILHKNAASRKKAQLTKKLNQA